MPGGGITRVLRVVHRSVLGSPALMSSSLNPLNLPAAALTVLQTRNATALSAIKSAADSERRIAQLVADASENLAQQAASGGAIPRGQIINILV